MDYRALIAPFIDERRAFIKTDKTLRKNSQTLLKSIDFLEQGKFDAPNEAYFEALKAHWLESFAQSTTNSKCTLTRKFFTWAENHKEGDSHSAMNTPDTISEIGREGYENTPVSHSPEPHDEILDDTPREDNSGDFGQVDAASAPLSVDTAEDNIPDAETPSPAISSVDAPHSDSTTPASEAPLPPQKKKGGDKHLGRPRKSPLKRDKKFSLYLTQSLFADIQDLARIQRVSTPDFIFSLLEREALRRAEALKAFRDLEE